MAIPSTHPGIDADATEDDEKATLHGVSVHTTCPGRHVFVEDDNTDAWIATDLVVSAER